MRLWSLHPKYLDARGLVALWREGLRVIAAYLRAVHAEAASRGYRVAAGRIGRSRATGRLTVTRGQLKYEWRHLRGREVSLGCS